MFRDILEKRVGPLTNSQFSEVMDLATADIKTNRVDFSRRTSLRDAVEIARSCLIALNRGAVA